MTDVTVFVAPNLTRADRKYHTDHDCPNASDRAREWTLERAKCRGHEEYSVCTGNVERECQGWTHQRAIKAHLESQDD